MTETPLPGATEPEYSVTGALADVEPPAPVPWERLDEVFLALTGHDASPDTESDADDHSDTHDQTMEAAR